MKPPEPVHAHGEPVCVTRPRRWQHVATVAHAWRELDWIGPAEAATNRRKRAKKAAVFIFKSGWVDGGDSVGWWGR